MADILLSSGVRSNLLALQSTSDQINNTQNRLATGKKVNSALDNATNFFLSASFRSSANNLSALLDGISNASRTLDAANAGITALTTLVNSASATVSQLQAAATTATTAIVTGSVSNLTGASTFATTAAKTIQFTDGTVTSTFTTVGTSTTVQQVIDSVNNTANLKIKAELSSTGQILLEAQGTNVIGVGGSILASELINAGLTGGGGVFTNTAGGTLNATRTTFAAQYDTIRAQIDALAADSGYNGVSLLNNQSLKTVLNEKATTSLTLTGVTDTAAGLGITASGGFQTNVDITNAVTNIANALSALKNQASTFASSVSIIQSRTDFTKSQINTLNTGADGLVLADGNQEGANLLALQTRQQLSSTTLSLATQADQSVLRLFR
ncbi:MAG: flagellin [Alphaproteobacteria bacterium]|jgi:flagellin-like hook-associated protein FlgL|nr:flagellin [Alphaproteobacteria bacterium]